MFQHTHFCCVIFVVHVVVRVVQLNQEQLILFSNPTCTSFHALTIVSVGRQVVQDRRLWLFLRMVLYKLLGR
jgi:hypothetical protein